jgi:hypothetical protein
MNLILKLLATGASIGAGLLSAKILDFVLDVSLRTAVIFAVVSGAVSQGIRVLTNRGTQRAIQRYQKTPEIV